MTMTYWSRFARGVLAVAVTVGLAAAAAAPASAQGMMDRILKEKKIKIGYIPSPPGTIKDPASGKVTGFYVEGVEMMMKMAGVEIEFVETTWGNFVAGLQSGQFDFSMAGTFATIQRAAAVEFTRPIHYLGYSAIVKKGDDRFKALADFNKEGLKIAVVQGGAALEYVKENFPKATPVILATGNLTAPFMEVSAGRADIGIEDAWQARRYAAQQPGVTDLFQNSPYNTLAIAWAVKRGNQDMLNFLNTSIDFMLNTGRWEKIAEKYGATGRFQDKPNLVVFGPALVQ
ncbi:MAG: amino acid ABC transporter substrate-binding protein [Alphaproteobacteria bacterium]|nr:amino acid ABC transporter substrate-binding protein [Alphaproteobacteria bacterium]